jgi:hypothetical protein
MFVGARSAAVLIAMMKNSRSEFIRGLDLSPALAGKNMCVFVQGERKGR